MSKAQKNRLPLADALVGVLEKGKFWTNRWHLVSGCSKLSPGCQNCWMEAEARIRQHNPHPTFQTLHAGLLTPEGNWNGTVRMNDHLLDLPLKSHRNSRVWAIWTDLFHNQVTDDFREKALSRMVVQQQDYFIIVTKRPYIALKFLADWKVTTPLSNVIILVTMEDQERANERAPHALKLASQGWTVGALCEPLLGPVDLNRIHESWTEEGSHCESWESCLDGRRFDPWSDGWADGMPKLSWVITGGESGHKARPSHPDWVRSLRDQAQAAGVPFMFKAWGEFRPGIGAVISSFGACSLTAWPDGTITWGGESKDHGGMGTSLNRYARKSGRLLDGVEHLEVEL